MSTACDERSARSDMTATAPFTLINVGAEQTQLVSGFGSTSQATMNLALGSEATAQQFFKRDPPAPHELERAIDTSSGWRPRRSAIQSRDAGCRRETDSPPPH
jgi:hypothetical protein